MKMTWVKWKLKWGGATEDDRGEMEIEVGEMKLTGGGRRWR